jgi:hypothetical protein
LSGPLPCYGTQFYNIKESALNAIIGKLFDNTSAKDFVPNIMHFLMSPRFACHLLLLSATNQMYRQVAQVFIQTKKVLYHFHCKQL